MNIPRNTRAAVLYRPGEPLVIEELRLPLLQPGQVLVKINYAGLCSTQLLEIQGLKGPDPWLPHALGHEGSGTVIAAGPQVTQVSPGDSVVLSWIKGPGLNAPGPKYSTQDGKVVNAGQVATFATFAIVSENRCTRVDPQFSKEVAALLGCAVPTGAGVLIHQLKAKPDSSVVVFGAGGVGMSAILASKMIGCNPIIAVDIQKDKLTYALELGATHSINAKTEDTLAKILELTRGGADYVIDATGARTAMETGFSATRKAGGKMVIAGNLAHGGRIEIDPFDLILGKEITGTVGGCCEPARDIPLFIELNRSKKMNLERLITGRYSLDQVNEAFRDLKAGALGRLLLRMDEA